MLREQSKETIHFEAAKLYSKYVYDYFNNNSAILQKIKYTY